MSVPRYIAPLSQGLQENGNSANAEQMKAYMKGLFDYFGIKAPIRKSLVQKHKEQFGLIPDSDKFEIVKWCWRQPQREYQYAAMDMLGKSARREDEPILDLYQFMIVEKSWWDTVDFIASNLVGVYFKNFPEKIPSKTSEWMSSGNMWLQRTCLLFQLKYKNDLDIELLEQFIMPLKDSKEFFIRKAIGWILREHSKFDPDYVRNFVVQHQLSGLSKREALRIINKT
jgi:3-methyladenine DNA glycosylase AlkD